ncbi:hypothetical protein [Paenibacillus alba]|uniref:Uncharacterized protein n=1 Tax=Paenibacillus alba TaxID=1197127 RepID=A0ABU6G8C6_9BACL|nr:hypothetical protein [Paenibacillus alba]MEC0229093.1 hypothetical protein [Paenibacillus alba]
MKNTSKLAIATLALSMLFATSAFAATAPFSGNLPANQGDTEISTVARANNADVVEYFSIKVTSLGTGYTAVRAWTEGSAGGNYSSPYTEVQANSNWATPSYTSTPSKGTNITLNLDNPVYTSSSVAVAGEWSPN